MKKISKRQDSHQWYLNNRKRILEERKVYYKNNFKKISLSRQKSRRTYLGYADSLYRSIQTRLKYPRMKGNRDYKGRKLLMSKEEFLNFITNNKGYKLRYKKWVKSGFLFRNSPCVDRIDNLGHYTLDNIQILTISENSKKAVIDKRICPHCKKTW
jgi:hypothetical protein